MLQTPPSLGFCGWLPAHATAGGLCEHLLIVHKYAQKAGSNLQDGEWARELQHFKAPLYEKQNGGS